MPVDSDGQGAGHLAAGPVEVAPGPGEFGDVGVLATRIVATLPRLEELLERSVHLIGHEEKATATASPGCFDGRVYFTIARVCSLFSLASSLMTFETKDCHVRPR
jgi:hypothetical protein